MSPKAARSTTPDSEAAAMAAASAQMQAAVDRLTAALRQLEAGGAAISGDAMAKPAAAPQAPDRTAGLMDWLRADLAARYFGAQSLPHVESLRGLAPAPIAMPQARGVDVAFPAPQPEPASIATKDRYSLEELVAHHDEAFLRNAFLAILRREPDPEGFEHYRWSLRDGRLTRRELLAELRRSPEGRAAGIRIEGLRRARFMHGLQRVPVLGRLVAVALWTWRLPALARRLERLEGEVARHQWESERSNATLQGMLREIEQGRIELASATSDALRLLEEAQREERQHLSTLASSDHALRRWAGVFGENLALVHRSVGQLQELAGRLASRSQLGESMQPVLDAMRALGGLAGEMEAQKGTMALVEAGAKQALVQAAEFESAQRAVIAEQREKVERMSRELREHFGPGAVDAALDAFYVDFEDRFRGTREDIFARAQAYLPDVRRALAAAGGGDVVDIGSGRGEWLEVLKEAGIAARGVDLNAAMARDSRARGLDVVQSDGLRYLRGLPNGVLAAVTAFHVIEHLQFPELVALFDESFRVLKSGGMVIFETPNPENVLVGSFSFWYDPTHVKPLPPDIVQHVAETRRFTQVEIRRMHPAPDWDRLPGTDEALRERLNALFYGPRDYAVIAYKP